MCIHVAYVFMCIPNYFSNKFQDKKVRLFLHIAMLPPRKVVLCYTLLEVNKSAHSFQHTLANIPPVSLLKTKNSTQDFSFKNCESL